MSKESVKTPFTSGNIFAPKMIYNYAEISIKFDKICLRQDSIPFIWISN